MARDDSIRSVARRLDEATGVGREAWLLALTLAVAVGIGVWLSLLDDPVTAVVAVAFTVVVVGCLGVGVLLVWELGRRVQLHAADTRDA